MIDIERIELAIRRVVAAAEKQLGRPHPGSDTLLALADELAKMKSLDPEKQGQEGARAGGYKLKWVP